MLPGPFQAPPIHGLPTYIPPLILWLLILGAAVAVLITFFRIFVAEPGERINNFLIFLLVLVIIGVVFVGVLKGPFFVNWFIRTVIPIFKR
jgi:hypothetical protein